MNILKFKIIFITVLEKEVLDSLLLENLKTTRDGFLYIFDINETTAPIDFDNLIVIHKTGIVLETNDYYPFGMRWYSNGNPLYKYKFGGKELQTELNLNTYDFHARQQDPQLGRFWGVDPMADAVPSLTPFRSFLNNPISFIDPSGMLERESTHTDEFGNVISVRNDGNLGIFKHNEEDIAAGRLNNDLDKQVGSTLFENSFREGDKIDFGSNRAKEWINSFENNQEAMVGLQPVGFIRSGLYAINATNRSAFDPKSYLSGGAGGGSQLSNGVYISNRDLGNFAAGAFARINGYDKQNFLAETGAFQLSGNNLSNFIKNHGELLNSAYSHKPSEGAFQRTNGEDNGSNYFIRLGYENIRTLNQFNINFSKIFYNDK